MVRVKRGNVARKKRSKERKRAKGFRGSLKTLTRRRTQALLKAGKHAYRSRKVKKRVNRSLWIIRINAALKELGTSYSRFMNQAKKVKLGLNRKMLAHLAVNDKNAFKDIVKGIIK